jgi:hypothetical protein
MLRIPVHGPGSATPKLTALLLNRAGRTMSELRLRRRTRRERILGLSCRWQPLPWQYDIALTANGDGRKRRNS